jgi:hypothetical protein
MNTNRKPVNYEDIIDPRAKGDLVECRACKGEGFLNTTTQCPVCDGAGWLLKKNVYVLTDKAVLWLGLVFLLLAAIGAVMLLRWVFA